MDKKQFSLHIVYPEPDLEPLKVIVPDDGTTGFTIGEDWEVRQLHQILSEYLATGKHDGEIPDYNEQLGTPWLNIPQAVSISGGVADRTIRWAASHGFIHGAEKKGRDWRFPQRTFLQWLKNRPKRGRK